MHLIRNILAMLAAFLCHADIYHATNAGSDTYLNFVTFLPTTLTIPAIS